MRSVVVIAAPVAFPLAALSLVGEALLARRPCGACGASFARDDERLPNEHRQPLGGRVAVLRLTAAIAGHDAYHTRGVEAGRQLREETAALLVAHDRRVGEIPQQLDPRDRKSV